MSALRLAFLVHDIDACGGMERQAALLATHLATRGHDLVVLSGRDLDASWGAFLDRDRSRRAGWEVEWIPHLRQVPSQVARELALVRAAWSLRQRGGVDALYAVQVKACPLASDLARMLGVPWVVKLAGGGRYGDMSVARAAGAEEELERLRWADRVVCLSEQIADEARAAGVADAALVRIPNGVDLAALAQAAPAAREELGLSAGDEPVLFVGRLDDGKRVDVLLRALQRLAPARPALRLLVAGTGPSEPALRQLAVELGLGERVRFLGRRDDVPALLRLARAFVLPSFSEGMSNALLEALAAGVPAVVSRIPGNEAVVDDSAAWLFPLDDPQALAAALDDALRGDAAAQARVEEGSRRIRERLDIARVAARYEALFEQLRSEPRRRPSLRWAARSTRHARRWLREQGKAQARGAVSGAVVALKRLLGLGAA